MSQIPSSTEQGANPKAAAKAAKAYAKASRPWYRKKRWWLVAVVAIIVIAVAAGGGGSDDGPTVVDDAGSGTSSSSDTGSETSADAPAEDAKPGTESNPVAVGQTVELAGTRYTVKEAATSSSVGGEFGTNADGVFVVVTLTIENKKNETKTFMSSAAKLVATNGTEYSTDDDGSIYAENPLILEDMQPDLPKTGVLVFDVPADRVKGALLKVSDLFGDGDAYIALGLR